MIDVLRQWDARWYSGLAAVLLTLAACAFVVNWALGFLIPGRHALAWLNSRVVVPVAVTSVVIVTVAALAATIRGGVHRPSVFVEAPEAIPTGGLLYPIIAMARLVVLLLIVVSNQIKMGIEWLIRFMVALGKNVLYELAEFIRALWDLNLAFVMRALLPVFVAGLMMRMVSGLSLYLLNTLARVPASHAALLYVPGLIILAVLYLQLITGPPFDRLSPSHVPAFLSLFALTAVVTVLGIVSVDLLWVAGRYLGLRSLYCPAPMIAVVGTVVLVVGLAAAMIYVLVRGDATGRTQQG